MYNNIGTNMSEIMAFGDWCGGATLTNSYVSNSVFNIDTRNWINNNGVDMGLASSTVNYSAYFGLNPLTPLTYSNVNITANCFSYRLIDGCIQNGSFYYKHLNTANVTVNFTNINGVLNANDIQTGSNWIYVKNTSNANVPAHIIFNVTDPSVVPFKDGVPCGTACSNVLNDGNTLSFNVLGFSNYSYGSSCISNWSQNLPMACNGILPNFTISYSDLNNCSIPNNLPVNNGTVVACCVERFTQNNTFCNGYSFMAGYVDDNHCGTNFTLPSDNHKTLPCAVEGRNSGGSGGRSVEVIVPPVEENVTNLITGGVVNVPSDDVSIITKIWDAFVEWIKGWWYS
jgi:hypothetical protein